MRAGATLLLPAALCGAAVQAAGTRNGTLARTPPMGWMSWEIFRCDTDCARDPDSCIGETMYKQMTDALASGGYVAAGYTGIHMDDCWERKSPSRDSNGRLAAEPTRFPSGMKALGDYMHSKGATFGLYTDEGSSTCGGYPASGGHEEVDAKTFADWGVDYIKVDGCGVGDYETRYKAMGKALVNSGRDIVYSCSWPAYLGSNEKTKPYDDMIKAHCNLWRNYGDIQCSYSSMASIIDHWGDYGETLRKYAAPGHWNDPDMLLIGNKCITDDEARTQMAIWSITASPLIMGNDVRKVPKAHKAILLNKEAIAVDQDPQGEQGVRVSPKGTHEVWMRPLENGDVAVALYNKGSARATLAVEFSDVGLSGAVKVRDIWARADNGTFGGSFRASVAPHGSAFLRLSGAAGPTPPAPPSRYHCDVASKQCAAGAEGHSTMAKCKAACGAPVPPPSACVAALVETTGGYLEACGGADGNEGSFIGLSQQTAKERCCADSKCAGFSFELSSGSGYYKKNTNCGKVSLSGYVGYSKPN